MWRQLDISSVSPLVSDDDELCVVEFSPGQGALHVEALRWWMDAQVRALLRTGRVRGDGSWTVIGVVPRREAAEYGEHFRLRYLERYGGGRRERVLPR